MRPVIPISPLTSSSSSSSRHIISIIPQYITSSRLFSSSLPSSSPTTVTKKTTSTIIIGAGIMGLSTAYHLSLRRQNNNNNNKTKTTPSITLIEKDFTYQYASSTLSAGGIRQQFSLKENIQMSLYTRDFLRNTPSLLNVNVNFKEYGYLFLATTPTGRNDMIQNHKTQLEAGCDDNDFLLLSPSELKERFDWLNVDDVILGSYGVRGEGWFDPWVLMKGMLEFIKTQGEVEVVNGEVVAAEREERSGLIRSVDVLLGGGKEVVRYAVDNVVNAAGAHAGELANRLAGNKRPLAYPLPVYPRRRCIYFFRSQINNTTPNDNSTTTTPPIITPLTIDPTHVYFRPEGNGYICGAPPSSTDNDHSPTPLHHKPTPSFTNFIWPTLYHRSPTLFSTLQHSSHWCGYYDYNTFDQNAIIGCHFEMENLILCNGFSGHGVQMGPAAGRAVSELVEDGKFGELDLGRMGFERVVRGEKLLERGIV